MEEFIKQSRIDIKENNMGDNYCIIVYHYRDFLNKQVKFIYKSIEEFEVKFKPEMIDSSFGVYLELWVFD